MESFRSTQIRGSVAWPKDNEVAESFFPMQIGPCSVWIGMLSEEKLSCASRMSEVVLN